MKYMKNLFYIVKDDEVLDFTTSLRTAKDSARREKADIIIECSVAVSVHNQEINKLRAYIYCSNIGIFESMDWAVFLTSATYKYVFSPVGEKLSNLI